MDSSPIIEKADMIHSPTIILF